MFTTEDLLSLDYFTVLQEGEEQIEIQSNNTRHSWKIVFNGPGFYVLYHKHHIDDPFHYQCSYPTLFDIVLEIVNHDEFQLRGRKPAKYAWQTRNSYFDELLRTYSA